MFLVSSPHCVRVALCMAASGDEGGLATTMDIAKHKARREARMEAKKLAASRAAFKKKREGEQATRKRAQEKETMHAYFSTSRNPSNASMLDLPRTKPWTSTSSDSVVPGPAESPTNSVNVSMDTGTPSGSSGDTVILSAK